MIRGNLTLIVLTFFLATNVNAFSQVSEKDLDVLTSIASGRDMEIKNAAAVVSVILERDIKKIGAFSIEDVLETIPGLHVIRNDYARSNKYVFRGMGTKFNTEALFMINGVPIKSTSSGNRTQAGFAGMPVDNISRIEVIRGPGSALYGADAYSGIINIILKENHTKSEVKARVGELNSKGVSVQSGYTNQKYDVYFSINYEKTNENEEVVEYDGQTSYDEIFNTESSLAPASPNFEKEILDSYLSFKYNNFKASNLLQYRKNLGVGFGANDVIDLKGSFDNKRNLTKLSYNLSQKHYDLNLNASYFIMKETINEYSRYYPEGAFNNLFPNGIISTPERTDDSLNLNGNFLYKGIKDNYIQLGLGYTKSRVYDIKDYRNYNIDTMLPKQNGVVDVSGTEEAFLNKEDRESFYLFIQDEIYLKKDLILTLGARYDYYNDFGDTINPRAALVWNSTRKLTSKVLYGRAFRAPSFGELYTKSSPIAFGNKNLNAAIIDTYELSFNYKLNIQGEINWNLFYYETKDQIEPMTTSSESFFENIGETSGYGGEVEFNYAFDQNISFNTNYSYQQSDNKRTNEDTVIYPAHLFYARLSFDYPKWNFNVQGNWVGTRKRASSDPRNDLRGYHKVDFNITRKNLLDVYGLNAKLYVKNLMDEDIREPSVIGGMKNDYPMPGRNAHIELSYKF